MIFTTIATVCCCTSLLAQTVTVYTLSGSGTEGSADGAGTAASFYNPIGVALDAAVNIYVADVGNYKIRKITPAGAVSTLAGSGTAGSTNGIGTAASFYYINGIALDATGNVYVADQYNYQIRKITPAGVVSTLAGTGDGSADGTGAAASFNQPSGVALDAAGNIYVADLGNYKIRKITPAGVVSTLAGSGTAGSINGAGAAASFMGPIGLAIDAAGNVYVADADNKIRKITPAGVVSTIAGSGTQGSADGTGAAASFKGPAGVALDAAGNVYVADAYNNKIRKITPAGVVSTIAGSGTIGSDDGTGATATFARPFGLALDAAGNVYIADRNNNKIRKITITSVTASVEQTQVAGLQFFPLPASDQLSCSLPAPSESVLYLELVNAAGSLVAGISYPAGMQELTLSVASLPAGLYLARLYTSQQKVSTSKVMVERH
jgi:serine/threonine protein kinase, bacterial